MRAVNDRSARPVTHFTARLPRRAVLDQTAARARRPLRVANLPPVANQVDVKRVVLPGGDKWLHYGMRLRVADPRAEQFEPPEKTEDVRVHREDRALAREEQHAARRLRPDAFERREKPHRLRDRSRSEERKVGRADARLDLVQHVFDDN